MKNLILVFTLLCTANLSAKPCASWFYANASGRGVIRVEAIDGNLDSQKLKATVADLNPAEWDTLAGRLQAKLGKAYRVTVFTAAEFEKSGHSCKLIAQPASCRATLGEFSWPSCPSSGS